MLNSIYDNKPQEYDALRACWLNERRLDYIKSWLRAHGAEKGGLNVLEMGSGTGWLLRDLSGEFPRCRFLGIEPMASYVEYSNGKATTDNVAYVAGTAEQVNFPVDFPVIDIILTNDMLHHVESYKDVFANIKDRVKAGTTWLLIEPNYKNPYTFYRQATKPGERNFWPKEFLQVARDAGWAPVDRDHLFLIPPFIKEPPAFAKKVERWFEGVPVLAGGLAIVMKKS